MEEVKKEQAVEKREEVAVPKKVPYFHAEKSRFTSMSLPPQFRPSSRLAKIFAAIFVIAIIISLVQFPLSAFTAGNVNVQIGIGMPWAFFTISMASPESNPFNFIALILDLLIYLVIAYAIDITLNFIAGSFSQLGVKRSVELYSIKQKFREAQDIKDSSKII